MTLEQCVEKFLRTVQKNPGLPVYCWVECEVVCGDEYGRWRPCGRVWKGKVNEMQDKLIEAMAKAVVYTCMVLAGAAVIFMFAGAAAAALRFMLGVM